MALRGCLLINKGVIMDIRTTQRTYPCGCIIDEHYDHDLPQDERIPTCGGIISKCEFHLDTIDDFDHFQTVLTENKKYNVSLAAAIDTVRYELTDEEKHIIGIVLRILHGKDHAIPLDIPDDIFHHQKAVAVDIDSDTKDITIVGTGLTDAEITAVNEAAAVAQTSLVESFTAELSDHAERVAAIDEHLASLEQ